VPPEPLIILFFATRQSILIFPHESYDTLEQLPCHRINPLDFLGFP
jgi:hypothetical protein